MSINKNNDNDNKSVEFVKEQLDFINSTKIFLIYYRTEKLIINIPNTITHLVFQSLFNQDITNFLPNNLTHIEFSTSFNKSVDNLPPNLLNLQFGQNFNQPVDNLPGKLWRLFLVKNLIIKLIIFLNHRK